MCRCASTLELYRWLLAQRAADLPWRRPPEQCEPSEDAQEHQSERDGVSDELLAGASEADP